MFAFFPIINSDSIMLSLLRVMTIDVFSKTYTSRAILPRLPLRWTGDERKRESSGPTIGIVLENPRRHVQNLLECSIVFP